MECPKCHRKGSVLKRVFSRRKGSDNRYCIYCDAEVKIIYNWKKIFLLILGIVFGLIILNFILQSAGWPGITGGFAGGTGGALIAVFMNRPPFVNVELVEKPKKKKRRN